MSGSVDPARAAPARRDAYARARHGFLRDVVRLSRRLEKFARAGTSSSGPAVVGRCISPRRKTNERSPPLTGTSGIQLSGAVVPSTYSMSGSPGCLVGVAGSGFAFRRSRYDSYPLIGPFRGLCSLRSTAQPIDAISSRKNPPLRSWLHRGLFQVPEERTMCWRGSGRLKR